MTIILGNYIDFNIKSKRGLPAFNPAASNRMLRFAQALTSTGEEAIIVSPGSAMTMKWTGVIFHKHQTEKNQNIKIHYCSAIGLPVIGMLFEQINVLFSIWRLTHKHNIKGLIVYCYYPSSVWASLFAKYILKITIVEDLEDICIPKISDWKKSSEANPIQQIVGWFLMKIMLFVSDQIIIPTSNFLEFIKYKSKVEIISGCIEVPILKNSNLINSTNEPVRVLFAGALEDENGIPLLIDFLRMVDLDLELTKSYIFDISGDGSKASCLEEEIKKLKNCTVNFHGFLKESEYIELLSKIKITLVLQNPMGRYSIYKTPSKGYEYLGHGKIVVVSEIGDFGQLPEDISIQLKPYDAIVLFDLFKNFTVYKLNAISKNAYNYSKNNWDSLIVGYRLNNLMQNKEF